MGTALNSRLPLDCSERVIQHFLVLPGARRSVRPVQPVQQQLQTLRLIPSGFYRHCDRAVGFMENMSGKRCVWSVVCWGWSLSFLPGLATSPSLRPALPLYFEEICPLNWKNETDDTQAYSLTARN